ncbi:MAG TPA: glucosyl-3-phosphoglycerate synthase [Candidatus Limnocylindrales bacterium]|nr:glucosyl-3-phosphoglycerate synthase [Candidatus Limnocylindrales bacterium]
MSHYRLLIPTTNPAKTGPMLKAISPLLNTEDSRGTLLGVIEIAPERSLSEGVEVARAYRALLSKIARYAEQGPGQLHGLVRIAHVAAQGIREAALETDANLLVLDAPGNRGTRQDSSWANAVEDLLVDPPCDVALVRPDPQPIRSVLVPVRGGPNAQLALQVAASVCRQTGATLSVLHVFNPRISPESRAREETAFLKLVQNVDVPVRRQTVFSLSVREAIIREAQAHQLTILGATLSLMHRPMVLGAPASRLLRRLSGTVMVVKTAGPVQVRDPERPFRLESRAAAGERVDRWFAENTFHSKEFRDLQRLMSLKERQGVTISLGLPTLNEQRTIGKVVRSFKSALMDQVPLLDEIVVIDSGSSDRTIGVARRAGVPVIQHADILARYGAFQGKGEALWKSLFVLKGDLICWVDTDITNIHPKFVYGLLGPLLTDPQISYVKGFYRRPLRYGSELQAQGGGRVTELAARPLLNLFFPELSGLVQPLSGEYAGRRSVLESVPFFTGYGVELGLLLAISEAYGLRSIAQVDLGMRVHRNQSLFDLSKMAFAIIQVSLRHLGDRHRIHLLEEVNKTMKLIHYENERYWIEQKEIEDQERPPMNSVPEYFLARHRQAAPSEDR